MEIDDFVTSFGNSVHRLLRRTLVLQQFSSAVKKFIFYLTIIKTVMAYSTPFRFFLLIGYPAPASGGSSTTIIK